ncbi:MAG: hypothetical protein J0H14_07215 [Alphaproteobacteria bacterium]|nr:hypothetical protein [Alphaproteobacteria bacterium]
MAATAVPKVSKGELRALVEKLVLANATLRTKSRESDRAAKIAATRIAELEAEVGGLEKKVAVQANASGLATTASASIGSHRTQRRKIDPGDAVPPGWLSRRRNRRIERPRLRGRTWRITSAANSLAVSKVDEHRPGRNANLDAGLFQAPQQPALLDSKVTAEQLDIDPHEARPMPVRSSVVGARHGMGELV